MYVRESPRVKTSLCYVMLYITISSHIGVYSKTISRKSDDCFFT